MIPIIFACLMVVAEVGSQENSQPMQPVQQVVEKKAKIQKGGNFNAPVKIATKKKQGSMHELISENRGSFE